MRVLILYDKPVHNAIDGSGATLEELAKFLVSSNNEVLILSLGKRNNKITKDFDEICIKSKSTNSKNIIISAVNNFSLKLFSRPVFYYRDILEKMDEFNPNLVITQGLASLSVDFTAITKYYKRFRQKVRIIALTDDVRQIEEHIKVKRYLSSNNKKQMKFLAPIIIAMYGAVARHIAYNMYDTMVKDFDGILFFTKEDLDHAIKRYKHYGKKFFVFRRPIKSYENSNIRYNLRDKLKTALFVGNCNNLPNIEALDNIVGIADKVNYVNFVVAGLGCNKRTNKNLKIVGYVKNLGALYLKADIFIAPLKSGSGIKIKLLECFKYGIPIIGTSIAFEGYPVKNGVNCIVEDEIAQYPNIIKELCINYRARRRLSENSKKIMDYFSYDEANTVWQSIMESIFRGR